MQSTLFYTQPFPTFRAGTAAPAKAPEKAPTTTPAPSRTLPDKEPGQPLPLSPKHHPDHEDLPEFDPNRRIGTCFA